MTSGSRHGRGGLARRPGVLPPVLDRIGTPSEFADLLWEVVGELGTSHAYIRPRATPGSGGKGQVGLLGADLSRGPDGHWQIDRVLPASPPTRGRAPRWPPRGSRSSRATCWCPWTAGRWTRSRAGPLLVGTAGRPVELTVARDGELPRRFAVTRWPVTGGCATRIGWPGSGSGSAS